jgi:hypothetical protein
MRNSPHRLPHFCRWEAAIEKNTKIPFRFRLGNVQYVDQLENKRRRTP